MNELLQIGYKDTSKKKEHKKEIQMIKWLIRIYVDD